MGNDENTNAGWTGSDLAGAAGDPPPDRRRDVVRRFVAKRRGFFESAGTYNFGHSEDSAFSSYKLRSRAVRSTYSTNVASESRPATWHASQFSNLAFTPAGYDIKTRVLAD